MKEIGDSFTRLRKVINSANTIWKFVIGFEVILIVIISIASNKLENFDSLSNPLIILILSALFYFLIKLFFFYNNKLISKSPIEEIEAKYKIDILSNSFARKTIINSVISESLIILNDQTCYLQADDDDLTEGIKNTLCEQSIKDGCSRILKPFLENVNIVFECGNNCKITAGVFFERMVSIDPAKGFINSEVIVLVKDDLGISEHIPVNLTSDAKELKLTIQNKIKESFKNVAFTKSNINFQSNEYVMVCGNIPYVCREEGSDGVLFLISDCKNNLPNDLSEIIDIINRVITNWKSKYTECVNQRVKSLSNE